MIVKTNTNLIHRSLYPRALSKQFSTIIKCSPLYLKIIATSYIQVHVFTNIIFPSSFAPKLSYIYTNYLYVYFIYISYTILTLISHIYSYPTYFYFTFITPRDFNSPNKSSQHIGTIDLSSTVIYFIADNNVQVPYCCTGTPIKLHTLLLESSRAALDFKYFRHPR